MSRKSLIIGFAVLTVTCGLLWIGMSAVHVQRIASYGAAAPESQLTIWGKLAEIVAGMGGITGIVGLITSWLKSANVPSLPGTGGIASEIELVQAALAWQANRTDEQATVRVVLAVIHEVRERGNLPEPVMDAAGTLAMELTKAIYAAKKLQVTA